jgi:universal stress protein A
MKTETLEPIKTHTPLCAGTASLEDAIAQSHPIIQLKNILVPLDFSETSLKSLRYAVPFAMQFGAKLTLLHVIQAPVYTVDFSYYPPLRPEQIAGIEMQLDDIRAREIPAELQVDLVVRESLVFEGILEVAREICADLIITTTHGHTGLKHLMMGSTAESIVRRAPCPVLVVRELEHDFV